MIFCFLKYFQLFVSFPVRGDRLAEAFSSETLLLLLVIFPVKLAPDEVEAEPVRRYAAASAAEVGVEYPVARLRECAEYILIEFYGLLRRVELVFGPLPSAVGYCDVLGRPIKRRPCYFAL